MSWQRIDENSFIDDTLVTCAEYQLFIDEMREQGKYYQPDQWTSYQFPEGNAREPILGVRHSDAVEFCAWLTNREGKEWKFRLPFQERATTSPMKPLGISPLGYWINNDYEFIWVETLPKGIHSLNPAIVHARNRNLDLDHAINQTSGRDHAATLDLALDLTRTLDHTLALESSLAYSIDIDKALTHIIDNDEALTRVVDRARSRASEIALVIDRDSNLDRDPDLALELAFDIDVAQTRLLFLARDRYVDLTLTLNFVPDRDLALDIYLDLFTLRERIAGRSPAFEGIRLVKERIR